MAFQANAVMRVSGKPERAPRAQRPIVIDERELMEQLRQKIESIVSKLQVLADDQVSKKVQIEERWYEDLRQYHGRYSAKVETELKAAEKSRVFVKQTRAKTLAWEARLSDMLFPTDDKNWGIGPTPVPSLTDQAKRAVAKRDQLLSQANAAQQGGNPEQASALAQQAQVHADTANQIQADMDEARRRSVLMEAEIEDQLVECKYNIRCRDAIHDACKLGSGIMKGPLTSNRMSRQWEAAPDGSGWVMKDISDPRPEMCRVDPWNFFPDMSARCPDDMEFTFERYLYTKKDLRKLAKKPGFDANAINTLLRQGPQEAMPPYVAHLRNITGLNESLEPRYQVWEYHGPLDHEDVVSIFAMLGDDEMLAQVQEDEVTEYNVIVWFCQGVLLKFGMHPLDSGDSLYSIFAFEKDETSVFGFGVPYLMRDSQNAINGSWRMMLDNAGLSVGPQVVIDMTQVEPVNGSWKLEPRKLWRRKKAGVTGGVSPFEVHNIPNNQAELAGIIRLAMQFADDEVSMPLIAQGEQASHITPTANGMSMLMNSANVVFRRVVKNFDDDMTTPNIRRLYDWNMQFSPRDDIKGDMQVNARGSSVLLVRELQSQNLMAITTQWSAHPVLSALLKVAPAARKTVQSMMIDADEIIKTDEELAQDAQAAAQQPQQPSPDMLKLEIAKLQSQTQLQIAQLNRDTEMMKLAEQKNMKIEELQAMLAGKELDHASKERILAGEIAAEDRRTKEAAAAGEQPAGSGGYIS